MKTRGLWSTLALVVVLAGLGAYIYFVLNKQTDSSSSSKQEKVFASVSADKIDEVKVSSSAGDATTIKKENGGWQIVQPAAAKADDNEVNGITSALASLEVTRVVDPNPSSLNDYGLSNPRIEIDFKSAGDKDYRKLLIGEKTPTGGGLFAKRADEKRVISIPAFQESTFDKKPFDLRDKTLIKFDRDKVDQIDIVANGKPVDFAKSGSDWTITKPIAAKADFGSVEGLVGKVQTAQMKSIASDAPSPADLKKFGLDKPQATIELAAGSSKATLEIGGKADDTTVYARDASKPMVMTIDKSLADDLEKGADDYRVKDLFQFRAYNANHVEITRGDQKIVFDRVKGEGDKPDKWHRASPNPADVDRDKVDGVLAKLANMRATSFLDTTAKTGLDKPAMTVDVKFDDNKKEEKVTFGKQGDDTFASRGEPGAMKIDTADYTEFNKALDEIAK
ncbi:MAG TPA: DUF4340 domain-containing protein [Vicinamibacterales bacterium]|nr:DUF4340 domain-containing protein [Vicinamibacterales bacterium]